MKKFLVIIAALSIAACTEGTDTSSTKKDEDVVNNSSSSEEFCYYRTEGNNNEDSFFIKLIITDNQVTGTIKYLPHEKDASVGHINGTKEGNIVHLKWTYYQEGIESTEPVSLKIDIDGIWQQSITYNDTGEVVASPNAPYTDKYLQIDCGKFPDRNF